MIFKMSRRSFVPTGPMMAAHGPPPPPPPPPPTQLPLPEDAPPIFDEVEEDIDLASLLQSEARQTRPWISPPGIEDERRGLW